MSRISSSSLGGGGGGGGGGRGRKGLRKGGEKSIGRSRKVHTRMKPFSPSRPYSWKKGYFLDFFVRKRLTTFFRAGKKVNQSRSGEKEERKWVTHNGGYLHSPE